MPHLQPPTWPAVTPGRFAARVRTDSPEGCRLALLGLPDNLGVRLNDGRAGARKGPAAFRAALATFGYDFDAATDRPLDVHVYDAGDVTPAEGDDADALAETHRRAAEAEAEIHRLGLLPIGVGGGHDLTWPGVRALSEHLGAAVGGLNIDAHLDVRETAGSGMPFRRAIETGSLDPSRFVEFGVGDFANAREHVEWLQTRGGTIIGTNAAAQEGAVERAFDIAFSSGPGFITIDLDGIDGSQTPGVSAVNPMGLPALIAARIARRAGAERGVRRFDIMELSPPHDEAGRTARLAALLFLNFVAGFLERSS